MVSGCWFGQGLGRVWAGLLLGGSWLSWGSSWAGAAIRALLAAGVADALQLVAAQPLGRPSRCGQDPIAEQGQGAFGLGGEAPTLL